MYWLVKRNENYYKKKRFLLVLKYNLPCIWHRINTEYTRWCFLKADYWCTLMHFGTHTMTTPFWIYNSLNKLHIYLPRKLLARVIVCELVGSSLHFDHSRITIEPFISSVEITCQISFCE